MDSNRILYIGKSPSPPWNDSAKIIIKNLLEYVEGFNIDFISDGGYQFGDNCYPRTILPKKPKFSLTLKDQIKIFLNLMKPNGKVSIYQYFFAPNMKSSLAAHFLKLIKPQTVIQTVLSMPKDLNSPELLFFGDHIITMSETAKKMIEKIGVSNVKTIYPGIKIEGLNKDEVIESKHTFHLTNEQVAIVYAGDYNKNIFKILDVAKELYHPRTEFRFFFAVRIKGDPNGVEFDREFRKKVNLLGYPENYITIFNEMDNFQKLLIASDIVILPETDLYAKMDIPLVLLEAMSYKKMVITSKHPMLQELNKDQNIWCIEDMRELKKVIELATLSVRQEMGIKNLNVVKKYFEATKMAEAYEKIYKKGF